MLTNKFQENWRVEHFYPGCGPRCIPIRKGIYMVKNWSFTLLFFIIFLMFSGIFSSCSKEKVDTEFLIRVRNVQVTLFEFQQAMESAKEEAFPGELNIDPEALNHLRVQVLNQLTEELIIIKRGKDLGLTISEDELNQAVEAIKSDYPDDTFEETLLEGAVSFEAWKDKLATRLLVEKVIQRDLIDQVQLTPDDITAYYQSLPEDQRDKETTTEETNEKMVIRLRRIKAEESYKEWMETLQQQYPVEVNRVRWEKLNQK
jgi:hypothetical protein